MRKLAKVWTREEVLALPSDGNRYELLDGNLLVSPGPTLIHQRAVFGLSRLLWTYVRQHRLGSVGIAPADLDFRSGQLLQPDVFVLRLVENREALHWSEAGIPLLIAEVLSPSTALYDRNRKRRRFQQARVGQYWIVDTDARLIERWLPDDERPEILTGRIEWHPESALPSLSIDLEEYFREVWGER